jgi:hypothetical protein
MAIEFATEKLFKIGLFVSTLTVLGVPTLAMMTSAFQTAQAITFQDTVVNEIQLVYAGKLTSINENLLLPKNTSVYIFADGVNSSSIIININTSLGGSGDIKKKFPTTVHRNGGDVPFLSEDESQCFIMDTKRDKSYATIKVTFTKKPCGT